MLIKNIWGLFDLQFTELLSKRCKIQNSHKLAAAFGRGQQYISMIKSDRNSYITRL